jgi:hypothetical protein
LTSAVGRAAIQAITWYQVRESREHMSNDKDTLRDEYPEELIKSGVRGKYAKSYRDGTNVVLIDPDLHKIFPDSDAVNRALREYLSTKRTAP